MYASRGNCTDHLSACKLGAFLAYTGAPYDSDIYDPYYNETNVLLIYFAILVAIVLYGLVCLVRSHAKLSLATAVVYLLVYLFIYVLIGFTAFFTELALDADVRGRIYAWHPELCQNPLKPGQRATICYEYEAQNTAGGSLPRIVYNPDDEMSLPESQWSKGVEQMFGGNLWTVQIARHVYLQDEAE